MQMNDPLDSHEPHAVALEFISHMQPLEWTEQPLGIGHIEAGTVIPDIENRAAVFAHSADFNVGMSDAAREFPGVIDEILERDAEQMWIGRSAQTILDLKAHVASVRGVLDFSEYRCRQCGDIDFGTIELLMGDPGQLQQFVNQFIQTNLGRTR